MPAQAPSSGLPHETEPLLATDGEASTAHGSGGSHDPDDGKQGALAMVGRNVTSGGVVKMVQVGSCAADRPRSR